MPVTGPLMSSGIVLQWWEPVVEGVWNGGISLDELLSGHTLQTDVHICRGRRRSGVWVGVDSEHLVPTLTLQFTRSRTLRLGVCITGAHRVCMSGTGTRSVHMTDDRWFIVNTHNTPITLLPARTHTHSTLTLGNDLGRWNPPLGGVHRPSLRVPLLVREQAHDIVLAGHDERSVCQEDARHPLSHLLRKFGSGDPLGEVSTPWNIRVGSDSLAEVEHRSDRERATVDAVNLLWHVVIPHDCPRRRQVVQDLMHLVEVEDR